MINLTKDLIKGYMVAIAHLCNDETGHLSTFRLCDLAFSALNYHYGLGYQDMPDVFLEAANELLEERIK